MSDFDPYYLWLQIPPKEQPPNHYRLLGLVNFESDANVIDNASEQRLLHLRSVQNGPHGRLAQKIMNEVSQARVILLNEASKSDYDAQLKVSIAPPPERNTTPDNGLLPGKSPAPESPGVSVSTRATARSIAYARKKKKSAFMGFVGLAILVIIVAGVGYVIWKNQRSDKDQVAGDPTTNKDDGKSGTTKNNKEQSSNVQGKKKSSQSGKAKKKQNAGAKKTSTNGGTGNNQPSGDKNQDRKENEPQKGTDSEPTKDTPIYDRAYLDELYARTFSEESEKELAVGEPISLFEHLKLPENLKQGVARYKNEKLVLESTSSTNLVDFPLILPANYDIHATVTRLPLTPGQNTVQDGFGFGIHVANHPCYFAIDHFPDKGYLTGPRTFINDLDSSQRVEAVKGSILPVGEPIKIRLQVRPTGIRMYADDKIRYSWQGTPLNLKPVRDLMPGTRNLFQFWLMSWKSRFQVEDLQLIPRGPAAEDKQLLAKSTIDTTEELGKPVDLVSKFKPQDVFMPPVQKDRFGIAIGPKKRLAGFEIPMEPADEYDLKMNVIAAGPEGLVFCLPVVDRQAMLVIDHELKKSGRTYYRTAMESVSGRYMDDPRHIGSLPVKLLNSKRETQLEIKVRRDSIRLFVNDKFTYGWSGSRYRLSVPGWRRLSINTSELKLRVLCLDDPVLIKKFTYRPVLSTNRLTDDYPQLVGIVQKLNPSLIDFWKRYEMATGRAPGKLVIDPSQPNSIVIPGSTQNSSDTNDEPMVDVGALVGTRKLTLSNLNAKQLEEMEVVRKNVAMICRRLQDNKFDEAIETIESARKNYDIDQARRLFDGMEIVANDWKSFWRLLPSRCALLKSTQQLEFSDSAAIVVSSSKDEIKLRYGGETKSYQTDELPLGIAMKVYEMTTDEQDSDYLRTRGSVFFMASLDDAKYGANAVQTWLEAENAGETIDDLIILIPQ